MRFASARQGLEGGARAAPALVVVLLVVLGAWLAARWVVYFAAAGDQPILPSPELVQLEPVAQAVADQHVFGVATAGASGAAVTSLNVKLKGVFAGGDSGVGIFNTGGKDEAKRVGSELAPGVVVESVHAQYAMLNRNGTRERVNLEERVSSAGMTALARPRPVSAPAQVPVQTPVSAPPATAVPPAMANRPSPGAGFQRPEPYAPVGDVATEAQAAPTGVVAVPQQGPGGLSQGLLIQSVPSGSMLQRLGLQPGDVVRSVNGERVTSEADVARILQQRGISGSFTAEVQRGGTTFPLAVGGQQQ